MANMKAKIQTGGRVKGKSKAQQEIQAKSVTVGNFELTLGDLTDVSVNGNPDGGMLQRNGSSGKYEVITSLENQNLNIIGGTY